MRRMIWIVPALVVVALASGTRLGDPHLYPVKVGDPAVPVYIIDNGFHIDLAIPRAELMRPGSVSGAATAALPDSPWVLLGWGDASYYRGSPGKSRLLDGARALLKPGNPAVIRMEPLSRNPVDAYEQANLTALSLSPAGFERMAARLDKSFAAVDGKPVLIDTKVERRPELYFASVEHFSVARSCVHWTSDLLHAAGVPGHRFFDGLVFGLMWDLRLRAGVTPHGTAIHLPPGRR